MELSGIALYRDNDNTDIDNGQFNAETDIPLTLDAAPQIVGQSGETIQVKFVFSTPGTDSLPEPLERQPRNRVWVPDRFASTPSEPEFGPEIFVVLRASNAIEADDNFRVGIVSWGPNTPTSPDPDTFARLSGVAREEFALFEEFPWADRGLGFITFFKEPQIRYFLDGNKARQEPDASASIGCVRIQRRNCVPA